jgi:hypothetical protein
MIPGKPDARLRSIQTRERSQDEQPGHPVKEPGGAVLEKQIAM